MNTRPLLTIIIPVFNQWPLTAQCLRGLRASTPGDFYQVMVVDNASTDETTTACAVLGRELFGERFACLRQTENLGFGPACNLGAAKAAGELLFFLNNDTVATPNWFPPLHAALTRESDLGAVGPMLLYPESERVQHLGVAFCMQKHLLHLYEFFPAKHPLVLQQRHVQALTGAALLLHRRLFLDCGSFFPEYANGYEDLELCARIREQGLKLRCIPQGVILHYSSQTPGRHADDQRNSGLFHRRCSHLFASDLHRHARQDSLELRLTPWLLPHAAMPGKDSENLCARVEKDAPPDILLALLEAHPLWEPGYQQAARTIEAQGHWDQSLELRLRQVNLCPSREAYQGLLRAALKCRRLDLAKEVQGKLEIIEQALSSPRSLAKKAQHLMHLARKMEDRNLEELYRNALHMHCS